LGKTLLGIWLVVWVGSLAVYVTPATRPLIRVHQFQLSAPESREEFPTIQRLTDDLVAGEPRPEVGDRVLRVGDAGLRGVNQLRFQVIARAQTGSDLRLPLLLERDTKQLETWVEVGRRSLAWVGLVPALAFAFAGVVLILRAPRSRAARFLGAGGLSFSLSIFTGPLIGPAELYYARLALFALTVSLNGPLFITGLLYFPDDKAPRTRWALAWPWIFCFVACAGVVGWYSGGWLVPLPLARHLLAALNIGTGAAYLAVLTWRYIGVGPIGRRRIKWVLIGAYLSVLPHIVDWAFFEFGRQGGPVFLWLPSVMLAFAPLSLVVAVLRFNLFDIDRLISATAAYTIVGIALLAGLLAGLPTAAAAVSDWLGVGTGASQLALSLLAAGIAVPFAQRLRPEMERILFADRHRMEQGTRALIEQLSGCREPRDLIQLAGERLSELLRPESCVVYGRQEGEFSPIFVRGRGGPPGFGASSKLVSALEEHTAPVAMERFARRGAVPALGPFDRAALETLEAAVVVPIQRRGAGMVGLVCLGPKLSGDVYTSTDLTLLAALSKQLSSELLRFEQEEVTRQADALRENLRAYVPGAVQEQLADADGALAGERDVTVLFVDIRGYTAFAQDRDPAEIFSTVNRYTQAVSEVVLKHEGHVVEFNGDGMMAVFGAPRALPGKEREAVKAGLEVGERMRGLGLQTTDGRPLSVGVGIATGTAYVGSVQSADRAIWTALGNTTNLAARLQSLTRDLDASIVIDAATQEAAGPVAEGFEKRERIEIRGRRDPEDLYLQTLAA
jgi:class 3 adenylate cyclase